MRAHSSQQAALLLQMALHGFHLLSQLGGRATRDVDTGRALLPLVLALPLVVAVVALTLAIDVAWVAASEGVGVGGLQHLRLILAHVAPQCVLLHLQLQCQMVRRTQQAGFGPMLALLNTNHPV